MHFTGLALTVISAFFLLATARPASRPLICSPTAIKQLQDWLSKTDANITYIRKPIGDILTLLKCQGGTTMVVYCSSQAASVCGGSCTMFNSGATCIHAPSTNCLFASSNIGFCNGNDCDESCNQFSSCGTPLDNGFCSTPGTSSIITSS